MNDGLTKVLVIVYWNPHILETFHVLRIRKWTRSASRGERGQDSSTAEHRELALGVFQCPVSIMEIIHLRSRNDFDFHCRWGKGGDLLLQSFWKSFIHGRSSRYDNIGIQVLGNVSISSWNTAKKRCQRNPPYGCRHHTSWCWGRVRLNCLIRETINLLYVISWTPGFSSPIREGLKRASGQRNRSFPITMTCHFSAAGRNMWSSFTCPSGIS